MKKNTITVFTDNKHWYESKTIPGVFYPSITEVNKMPKGEAFDKYMASQESYEDSKRILNELAERGTRVHKATELLETGEPLHLAGSGLSYDEYQLVVFFANWYSEHKPKTIGVELRLVSDHYKLGGTVDRLYLLNGKKTILDIKTSRNAIYDYHFTQCGGYALLYEDMFPGEIVEQTAILRLTDRRKDGYELVLREGIDLERDKSQFLRNHETYKYQNKYKDIKPKSIELPESIKIDVNLWENTKELPLKKKRSKS